MHAVSIIKLRAEKDLLAWSERSFAQDDIGEA